MALDQNNTADHSGDRPLHNHADHTQEGALQRMQADSIPAAGQNAAGANHAELRGLSHDKGNSLPSLEIVDGKAGDAAKAAPGADSKAAPGADSKGADAKPDAKDPAKPDTNAEPFTEVNRTGDFDSKKPTVAFLDEFKDKNVMISDDTNVAHGEISRAAAEKAGFNTIALQYNESGERGANDYSKQFNAVADQIDSGKLPLGKGDALNVSMGNADPTFKEASKFLGFDVNAQNLAGEKDHILQRMGEISKDPSRSAEDRTTADRVVRTNEAIDRVQSHGADVVQAAGNTGADRFSWDFMNANKQLSSAKPSGKADDFSADHSLATKGDGVIPVTIDNKPNMLDPTPLKNQTGTLEIGDTGVKFPERGKDAFLSNTTLFDREKIKPEYSQPRVATSSVEATSADLKPELTMPKQPADAAKLGDTAALPANKFSGPTMDGHWTKAFPITDENRGLFSTPKDGQKLVTKYIDGTSFVNMQYFKDNMARMAKEKAAQ